MPGKRPLGTEGVVSSIAGAATARRPGMFDLCTKYDPVTPTGGLLFAEVGIDIGAVREALADDLAPPLSGP